MAKKEELQTQQIPSGGGNIYKIVGAISAILISISLFVGATLWISTHVAGLKVKVDALKGQVMKIAILVEKNSDMIHQYAKVMVLLEQQGEAIRRLQDFADEGARVTPKDIVPIEDRISALETWTAHAPPDWFENQIQRFMNHTEASERKIFSEIDVLKTSMIKLTSMVENHLEVSHPSTKKKEDG